MVPRRTAVPLALCAALAFAQAPEGRTAPPTAQERADLAEAAYKKAIADLRETMVAAIDKKIAAVRASSGSTEDKQKKAEPLTADRDRCKGSNTNVPVADELLAETQTYERGARKARQDCRKAVLAIAAELERNKQSEESDQLIKRLNDYCPACIDPAAFAARLKDSVRANEEIKKGRAALDAVTFRDRLKGMVERASKSKVSAEDLTAEARALVDFIHNAEPYKNPGKHKARLEEAEVALKALLSGS